MFDSLTPWTVALQLLCPWNSPGKNTGVDCYSLLQGIFLAQALNPGFLQSRQILYYLRHQGSPPLCKLLKLWENLVHQESCRSPSGYSVMGFLLGCRSPWLSCLLACAAAFLKPISFAWRLHLLCKVCWFPYFQSFSPGHRCSLFFSSCWLASLLTLVGTDGLYHIYMRFTLLHGSFPTPDSLLHGRDCSFHCWNPLV